MPTWPMYQGFLVGAPMDANTGRQRDADALAALAGGDPAPRLVAIGAHVSHDAKRRMNLTGRTSAGGGNQDVIGVSGE